MRGLRDSMPASHGLACDGSRAATFAAELAPRMISRRRLRSPTLEMRPRRSLRRWTLPRREAHPGGEISPAPEGARRRRQAAWLASEEA